MTKDKLNKILDTFYFSHKIDYDGRRHIYKLDGITCAGVSSISEYRPKPYLKFWAAKLVSEFLKNKLDKIKNLNQKEWEELLYEAKNQHIKRSKDALDMGKRSHTWCEEHIKGKDLPITDDIKNPVNEFLKFEKKHKVQWLAVEKIVCSPQCLVAGRLDAIGIVDRKLSLIDFKTSKQIDESYYLQTAGYQMCLEEMGIPVEQRIILRLPKKAGDGFEPVLVDTDYEKDKKAFLNQRYSREWNNYVECNFKEDVFMGKYKVKKLKLNKL